MQQLQVAIVGGGVAGVGLGAQLGQSGVHDFAILERDCGLGGTWRANTYPGAACDVPSHLYSYSFAPNSRWSRRFPSQEEILRYLERVADQYGVRERVRSNTEVTRARFDGEGKRWRLQTDDGAELEAQVLVAACGQLSTPSVPAFPGLEDFRGEHWHSARWDHAFDPRGKRIAVLGTGASSIQIVPELAREADSLHVFQRTPPWIVPRRDRPYTRPERKLFERADLWRRIYRSYIYWRADTMLYLGIQPGHPMSRWLERTATKHLEEQVPDPELREKLMPRYPIGCKRILFADDYYPALQLPNVELVTDGVERFVPEGIRTADGRVRELDAVVFATGFESQELVAPMEVVGPDGRTLDELWASGPQAHLGVTVAGMPNLFLLYGPNTNLGHNSIIFMLECQFRYIVQCLEQMKRRGAQVLDTRPEAMERFNEDMQERLGESIWSRDCTSWYKNDAGRITNNWWGPAIAYWWATRRPNPADFALS